MEINNQMKNALSGSLSDSQEKLEEAVEESFDSIDGLDTLAKEIAKIMDSSSYEDELELSFCDKYYYISKNVLLLYSIHVRYLTDTLKILVLKM